MQSASLAFDYEVGPRPGEKLRMMIRDIIFEGKNVIAYLRGKTGERKILLVNYVSKLLRWIRLHPMRNDPEAPLWISIGKGNSIKVWSYAAYVKFLRVATLKASISKKVVPYTFRHTAVTRDANLGFNEVMLCKKYDWRIGSKMPLVYIHLSTTDLFTKIREIYGSRRDHFQILYSTRTITLLAFFLPILALVISRSETNLSIVTVVVTSFIIDGFASIFTELNRKVYQQIV